jgi:hypothetical protein
MFPNKMMEPKEPMNADKADLKSLVPEKVESKLTSQAVEIKKNLFGAEI